MWVPAWGRESEGDKGRQVEIEEMGREMREIEGERERDKVRWRDREPLWMCLHRQAWCMCGGQPPSVCLQEPSTF